MVAVCAVPPAGWYCTRKPGHDGPCAALPLAPIAAAALARWEALPADERNGERPWIMGFNAGWYEALAAEAEQSS